eukprot:2617966-Amphidinium_carterae.1
MVASRTLAIVWKWSTREIGDGGQGDTPAHPKTGPSIRSKNDSVSFKKLPSSLPCKTPQFCFHRDLH